MLLTFVLFLIGLTGSFLSGMLGMGGAIINFPMLLFIPPLIGLTSFTPHEVSGISMIQVLFTTLAGVLSYRNTTLSSRRLVLSMGIPCLIGSLLGGVGANIFSGEGINLVYLLLAITASILMFVPTKVGLDEEELSFSFSKWLAIILSFLVGIFSGIVGAGGAFILIPIMLTILKIPTRVTIASSLAIVFLSSIGGAIGKIVSGDVLFWPTLTVVVASVIGAPLGAFISRKIPTRRLRYMLAILILISSFKMAIDFFEHFLRFG
ncbi:hypothetical protein BEP19_06140 [Ammoniphilus oxalaticus]|uniref:Probable membrane transporter protein n=1 Tax=Ammoniphilus oxalaticus TaxID=66863 RepID=A0A419SJ28_9BACL|nr:sulfite exporter TauE/SafE family protein [Ammoniphilus oxalaticus]RKD23995.1 hypothetical protein BEP19_06140 [Ammoniphilus oxalaticus]